MMLSQQKRISKLLNYCFNDHRLYWLCQDQIKGRFDLITLLSQFQLYYTDLDFSLSEIKVFQNGLKGISDITKYLEKGNYTKLDNMYNAGIFARENHFGFTW